MPLQDTILRAIRQEISEDPERRGYDGKSDDEILSLLNESYEVDVIVKQPRPSRMNVILAGIAETPNAADRQDVIEAKALS